MDGSLQASPCPASRLAAPPCHAPPPRCHGAPLQAASKLRPDMEAAFELSIGNADKGLLPMEEIKRRVSQFTSAGIPLVLTQVGASALAWLHPQP